MVTFCDCVAVAMWYLLPQTTPGDYLDEGRVLAAQLCRLWGLELPAIFHALEAAHGTVEVGAVYWPRDIDVLQLRWETCETGGAVRVACDMCTVYWFDPAS